MPTVYSYYPHIVGASERLHEAFLTVDGALGEVPEELAATQDGVLYSAELDDSRLLFADRPATPAQRQALLRVAERGMMPGLERALEELSADATGAELTALLARMAQANAPAIQTEAGILGLVSGERVELLQGIAGGDLTVQQPTGDVGRQVMAALAACAPVASDPLERAILQLPPALQAQARRSTAALAQRVAGAQGQKAMDSVRRVLASGLVAGSRQRSAWTQTIGVEPELALKFVDRVMADISPTPLLAQEPELQGWAALKSGLGRAAEMDAQLSTREGRLALLNETAQAQHAAFAERFGTETARPLANMHMAMYAIARDTPALDPVDLAQVLERAGAQALTYRRFDPFMEALDLAQGAARADSLGSKLLAGQAPQALVAFSSAVAAENAVALKAEPALLSQLVHDTAPGDMLAQAGQRYWHDPALEEAALLLREAPAPVQGSFLALADRLIDMGDDAAVLRRALGTGVRRAVAGNPAALDALVDPIAQLEDPVSARFVSGAQRRLREAMEQMVQTRGMLPMLPGGRPLSAVELRSPSLVSAVLQLAESGDRTLSQTVSRVLKAVSQEDAPQPQLLDMTGRLVTARLGNDSTAMRGLETELRALESNASTRKLAEAMFGLLDAPSVPQPVRGKPEPATVARDARWDEIFNPPAANHNQGDELLRHRGPELSR